VLRPVAGCRQPAAPPPRLPLLLPVHSGRGRGNPQSSYLARLRPHAGASYDVHAAAEELLAAKSTGAKLQALAHDALRVIEAAGGCHLLALPPAPPVRPHVVLLARACIPRPCLLHASI
jgi:hypothetical protein